MIEHTDNPLIFNTAVNNKKYATAHKSQQSCPFCEVASLSNILRQEQDKIWLKNKFSTIEDSFMTVIIESAEHLGDISSYSQAENRAVFQFAFSCWQELLDSGKYQSVLMFKNFGPHSGGTLRHPHLQIVGLEQTDGYEHISPENFEGVSTQKNQAQISLSTKPIMGFVEFNISISDLSALDDLADSVHTLTHYLLEDYMGGRCDSYNLFFYKIAERYICKIVPRFITSPYFIGYKLPQVNRREHLAQIITDIEKLL